MYEGLLKEITQKAVLEKDSKKIMLLLTGANHYLKEIFDLLKGYRHHSFVYLMSKHAEEIHLDSQWNALGRRIFTLEEAYSVLPECHMLLLPFLTRNLLAKASVGIADDSCSTILQTALMMGKQVLAIDSCCNPDSEYNMLLKLNQNSAYHNMLLNHKNALTSFGVTFVPAYKFSDALDLIVGSSDTQNKITCTLETSNMITYKDLVGKETFQIPPHAKLTDLAKDYLKEKMISVL